MQPDDNPYSYLRHLARAPLIDLDDSADAAQTVAERDVPPFNSVFDVHLDSSACLEPQVAKILARRAQPHAAIWWLGPSTTPAQLPNRLRALGLRPVPPITVMRTELVGRPMTDLEVRPVRSPAELDTWVDVLAAAYGMPAARAAFARHVHGAFPLTEDAPAQHFVARIAGIPVAVATSYRTSMDLGIYNVGTLPQARGQGIGTRMMTAVLADAFDRGYWRPMLGAVPGAKSVYARLGFVEEATLHRLAAPPELFWR